MVPPRGSAAAADPARRAVSTGHRFRSVPFDLRRVRYFGIETASILGAPTPPLASLSASERPWAPRGASGRLWAPRGALGRLWRLWTPLAPLAPLAILARRRRICDEVSASIGSTSQATPWVSRAEAKPRTGRQGGLAVLHVRLRRRGEGCHPADATRAAHARPAHGLGPARNGEVSHRETSSGVRESERGFG